MATALLTAEAQTESLVPASRIMRERDDYRARAAQEFTRAEQLDRELSQALQSVEDWRHIALSNGDALAHERVEHARTRQERFNEQGQFLKSTEILRTRAEIAERWFAEERKRSNALAKWIEDSGVSMSDIEDLIREAGVDCPECATHGPSDECSLLCVDGLVLR